MRPLSTPVVLAPSDGDVDGALARARGLSNIREYYVSVPGSLSLANTANRRQAGDGEEVLAFGVTLLPTAHALHQALAAAQAQRGDAAEAIRSYETASRLNPQTTDADRRAHAAATKALAELRAK